LLLLGNSRPLPLKSQWGYKPLDFRSLAHLLACTVKTNS
jgi:hypothetical protein